MANEEKGLLTGRLVFVIGDLFAGDVAKIYGTQTPKVSPKTGQQYREYGFGLAVPKTAFQDARWDAADFWQKLHQFVGSKYNGQVPPNFKWKYIDGDTGVTQEGVKVNTKQGYPGHMVFTFKTTITPKFFKGEGPAENRVYTQISEGIKCGDWVRVQASFDMNLGANASVYLNPQAVEFVGYGEAIINAPSGAQTFGAGLSFMPPGASATPLASSAPMPSGLPAQLQQPAWGQPPAQAPAQQAPLMNYGVMPAVHHPPQNVTPMPGMSQQPVQPAWGQPPAHQAPAQVPNYAQQGMPMPAMPGMPQR